jgi:tRNA pseudouridine55 synthase
VTDGPCGLLVVDKPGSMSSHGVVGRVRRLAGTRRVGHAGTLDPMATGVLVLGVGRGTRLLTYLVGADKEYVATIRLGASTTTDDAEGDVVSTSDASHLAAPEVRAAMGGLRGTIDQVPSAVSAIKVDGKRAYARVRDGEDVVLPARRVTVTAFDLLTARTEEPFVDVDVHVACSSGTYVRALARDLGATLGVGGHLTALRRTRVGPFTLQAAHRLDDLAAPLDDALVPLGAAAASFLPERTLTDDEAAGVRHGVAPAPTGTSGAVALRDAEGALVAVAEDVGPRAGLRAVFVG